MTRAPQGFMEDMTPESIKRRALIANTSEKGRKARAASPWNKGPMCDTPNAGRSFKRYQSNAKP